MMFAVTMLDGMVKNGLAMVTGLGHPVKNDFLLISGL